MENIEFKQMETKAALSLMNDLRTMIESEEKSASNFEKKCEKENKSEQRSLQFQEWTIQSLMKVELLKNSLEKIQKDIENQSFDF